MPYSRCLAALYRANTLWSRSLHNIQLSEQLYLRCQTVRVRASLRSDSSTAAMSLDFRFAQPADLTTLVRFNQAMAKVSRSPTASVRESMLW